MAQFKFNEEDAGIVKRSTSSTKKNGLAGILVSWGVARDLKQAQVYLLVTLLMCLGFIAYININTFAEPVVAPPILKP